MMTKIAWTGANGDWNDAANWGLGVVPLPTDTVEFSNNTTVAVTGSSYIGALYLNGANVSLDGNFSGDGTDPSAINDGTAQGDFGTLTVGSWASVAVDTVALNHTSVVVQGLFANTGGQVANAMVSGTSAEWLSGHTNIIGTLSAVDGGIAAGTFELVDGTALVCDNTSTFEDGTLDAVGNSSLTFVQSPSSPATFYLGDALNVSAGSTLSLSSPAAAAVELNSTLSGSGTLQLEGRYLLDGSRMSLSTQIMVIGGALSAENLDPGTGAITLENSALDLSHDVSAAPGSLAVNCQGSTDTVFGGSVGLVIDAGTTSGLSLVAGAGSVTLDGGSAAITVSGGSGSEVITGGSEAGTIHCGTGSDTVFGESGALYVEAGSGADKVWGGTSGNDTIIGGSGRDTLVGGTGAKVYAEGSGPTFLGTYTTVDGALLDASGSSGQDTLFAGGGSGIITMVGGSGSDVIVGGDGLDSITCGTGNTSVFSGSHSGDTIVGGSGSDVLVGGPGANITLVGSAANGAVAFGGGTLVNATISSGNDTVFACGSGVTTILGGSGSECIVGTTSYMSVVGGSGALAVWGGPNGHDTIMGGSGNDTLVASSYSDVVATGAGSSVLISQGSATTLDASQATGDNQFFLSGPVTSGSTDVRFGSGSNLLVGSGQSAELTYQGGAGVVWAGEGGLDISMAPSGATGMLDVYQFNAGDSTITMASADYEEYYSGGNTTIVSGGETVVLHGTAGMGSINISVASS